MAGAAGIAAAALLAASFLPPTVLILVVALLTVAVGMAWPFVLQVPAAKTLGVVLSLSGLLAIGLVLAGPGQSSLDGFPAAVALGVAAVFLVQLFRGTGQSQRLESTLGAVSGVLVATSGAGWIAAARLGEAADRGLIPVAAAGLLAGCVGCFLVRLAGAASILLGAAAGAVTATLLGGVDPLAGAGVGLFCGVVAAAYRRLAGEPEPADGIGEDSDVSAGPLSGAPSDVPAKGRVRPGRLASYAASGAPAVGLGALVYFVDRMI